MVTYNALVPSTLDKFSGKMTYITPSREVDKHPPFYFDWGQEMLQRNKGKKIKNH